MSDFYTVVFRGNIRAIGGKLFTVIDPLGEVVAISIGDVILERDALEEHIIANETGSVGAAPEKSEEATK